MTQPDSNVSDEWVDQQEHERAKELMQKQGRTLAFSLDPALLLEVLEEAMDTFGADVTIDDINDLLNQRGIQI